MALKNYTVKVRRGDKVQKVKVKAPNKKAAERMVRSTHLSGKVEN